MVIKEIGAYLLVYNLIRLMMAQAAVFAHRLPRQISFKHTVQICNVWTQQCHKIEHEDRSTDYLF